MGDWCELKDLRSSVVAQTLLGEVIRLDHPTHGRDSLNRHQNDLTQFD